MELSDYIAAVYVDHQAIQQGRMAVIYKSNIINSFFVCDQCMIPGKFLSLKSLDYMIVPAKYSIRIVC